MFCGWVDGFSANGFDPDSKFSKEHPNVVHMTVKPQEVIDEEDAKGAKAQYSREREASERSPGCRCVIL
jgi:hypothetical protein